MAALVMGALTQSAHGAGPTTTWGVGEGHPPARADLSPAQRRLMARRAAEVRALRDALTQAVGTPRPSDIRTGHIQIQGRIAGLRVLETQELPDGRCRAVVEVTLPVEAGRQRPDPIGEVLTDYLQSRSDLLRSRQKCVARQAQLEGELGEATASIRQSVAAALKACQFDLTVIDWALADLEAKTVNRLPGPTTTSGPSI